MSLSTLSFLVIFVTTTEGIIPASLYPKCLSEPGQIIGDSDNCHLYYHCEVSPSPVSCGDMMFNTKTQTCDWPYKVLQIRSECRKVEQFRFRSDLMFPFQRTMRMLSFYEDPVLLNQKHYQTNFNDNYEEKPRRENYVNVQAANDPNIKQTILLEIQRRIPQLISSKLTNYIKKFKNISKMHQKQSLAINRLSRPVTATVPPPPTTTTTTTTSTTTTTTSTTSRPSTAQSTEDPDSWRSFIPIREASQPIRSDSVPSFKRPQQTPYDLLGHIKTKTEASQSDLMPRLQRPQPTPYDLLNSNQKTKQVFKNRILHKSAESTTSSDNILATNDPLEVTTEYITENVEVDQDSQQGPAPAPVFTRARGNDRQVFTVTRERPNLRKCKTRQCARPRKLVLRRRKVRRKLLQNEKDRLNQRRQFLSIKTKAGAGEFEEAVDDKITVNEVSREDEDIEKNPTRKKEAFDNALERLKSLVEERNSQPEARSKEIVRVTYTTSTDNFRKIKSSN